MTRLSHFGRIRTIEMSCNGCHLLGIDPDDVVSSYIVDTKGQRHRIRETRWRWYQAIGTREDDPKAIDTTKPGDHSR